MSSFNAFDFIYDGTPSQKFDLKIINLDSGGLFTGVGSSDVNILTQRVLRKSKPYYLGRTQEPVLEFPLTFGTVYEITALDRSAISSWLFGRSTYKKLYILQDDMNGAYFNCFLTRPEPVYVGGLNYAFNCQVVCDSPFAYLPERIISDTVTSASSDTEYELNIYNNSDEDEYLYPEVYFSVLSLGGGQETASFSLSNASDVSSEAFLFENLNFRDTITVNNDLQIVSGLNGNNIILNLLSSFSTHWFRLVPKNNVIQLEISPYTSIYYEIKFTERMKIGG